MESPKYVIVNRGGSNAQIVKIQEDRTYTTIAFAAGEDNLKAVIELVAEANK